MESKRKNKENEWLKLLEEAINEGVKIQMNHRFKYKGKNLGTFLTGVKRSNKKELIKKIERLGVKFKMHSKQPEDYLAKFIKQLSAKRKPNKQEYITRFNVYVLPKKEILKEETIEKLNKLWLKKFGDVRKWEKPDTVDDKIRKWKEFRYNKEINPNEKWFHYKKNMGKLYSWVYTRKRSSEKMNAIVHFFNEKELVELQKEGFNC